MSEKGTCAGGLRDHAGDAGPIRLLVVGRRPAVRKGLEIRPALGKDLEVVGEAADVTQAIQLAQARRPDVILVDVDVPRGFAVTEALRSTAPHSTVVILKLRDVEATRERTLAAASGTKRRTQGILLATIEGAALANARRRRHEGVLEQRGGMRECRA